MPGGWWVRAKPPWWILKFTGISLALKMEPSHDKKWHSFLHWWTFKETPPSRYIRHETQRSREVLGLYWGRNQNFLFYLSSLSQQRCKSCTANTALLHYFKERLGLKPPTPSPTILPLKVSGSKWFVKQLPQNLHQRLAFFFLSPELLGAYTNLSVGLNICYDLIEKLNFQESCDLFAIFWTSFVKFFVFLHEPQSIKN